jgi:hypothetical protein
MFADKRSECIWGRSVPRRVLLPRQGCPKGHKGRLPRPQPPRPSACGVFGTPLSGVHPKRRQRQDHAPVWGHPRRAVALGTFITLFLCHFVTLSLLFCGGTHKRQMKRRRARRLSLCHCGSFLQDNFSIVDFLPCQRYPVIPILSFGTFQDKCDSALRSGSKRQTIKKERGIP